MSLHNLKLQIESMPNGNKSIKTQLFYLKKKKKYAACFGRFEKGLSCKPAVETHV